MVVARQEIVQIHHSYRLVLNQAELNVLYTFFKAHEPALNEKERELLNGIEMLWAKEKEV